MTATVTLGVALAVLSAFCYAFASVAATKDARANGGRGTAVLLSVLLTALLSAIAWLFVGPPLPAWSPQLWQGVAAFCTAGLLATVLGRVSFFARSSSLVLSRHRCYAGLYRYLPRFWQ